MDAVRDLLEEFKKQGLAQGNILGLLHIFIGRRITAPDGTVISAGLTWRDLAALLKKVRWDPQSARELAMDPDELPPRDRERFWYSVITRAEVHSEKAIQAGDKFAEVLKEKGYTVGPPPGKSRSGGNP